MGTVATAPTTKTLESATLHLTNVKRKGWAADRGRRSSTVMARGESQGARSQELGKNPGPTSSGSSWCLPALCRTVVAATATEEMKGFFCGIFLLFPVRYKKKCQRHLLWVGRQNFEGGRRGGGRHCIVLGRGGGSHGAHLSPRHGTPRGGGQQRQGCGAAGRVAHAVSCCARGTGSVGREQRGPPRYLRGA